MCRYFGVCDYQAEADALRAAIEFRKGLERSGTVRVAAARRSGVKGVFWHSNQSYWQVRLIVKGRRIHGGNFKAEDSTPEEVERARLLAVESHRKLKEMHFAIQQSHFVNAGKTNSEAEADALHAAAIEFRKGLKRSGIAKAPCVGIPQSA